jgi:hypothetical protein
MEDTWRIPWRTSRNTPLEDTFGGHPGGQMEDTLEDTLEDTIGGHLWRTPWRTPLLNVGLYFAQTTIFWFSEIDATCAC